MRNASSPARVATDPAQNPGSDDPRYGQSFWQYVTSM